MFRLLKLPQLLSRYVELEPDAPGDVGTRVSNPLMGDKRKLQEIAPGTYSKAALNHGERCLLPLALEEAACPGVCPPASVSYSPDQPRCWGQQTPVDAPGRDQQPPQCSCAVPESHSMSPGAERLLWIPNIKHKGYRRQRDKQDVAGAPQSPCRRGCS